MKDEEEDEEDDDMDGEDEETPVRPVASRSKPATKEQSGDFEEAEDEMAFQPKKRSRLAIVDESDEDT